MHIPTKLKELNLEAGSYIVVGSGILGALGIRESGDIDLIVSQEVYDRFEADGWGHGQWSDHIVLQQDVFDLGRIWYGKSVADLLVNAQYVEYVPYLSLEDVYEWKKNLGREKDLRDLKLIEDYWAR